MASNWIETTIGEFASLQRGHDLPEQKRISGLVPILGSFGVTGYHNEAKTKGPGVTVGRSGASFGVVAYSKVDYWPLNTALYVTDFHGNNEKFVYYFFKVFDFSGLNSGSAQPSLNRNFVHPIRIKIPQRKEQDAIAEFLTALDDKIELNRQMNATVESMAQSLFKSWFVDFDFPGFDGKLVDGLPQDWKKMKLEELIDTVSVTHTFPKDQIIFLNTSDIHDGQVLHERYSEVSSLPGQAKKTIKKNDILFSEIRPANKRHAFISFDAENYVVSTKLMVLRAKSFVDPVAIYHYLKRDEVVSWLQILAESRSGTFPQITFQQLKSLEMIVPDKKWLKLYTDNLKALFEKVRTNHKENNKLSEVRDALLPKLISGQLRIPEEERLAEAAM